MRELDLLFENFFNISFILLFFSIIFIIFLSDSVKKPKEFVFSFISEITIVSSPLVVYFNFFLNPQLFSLFYW